MNDKDYLVYQIALMRFGHPVTDIEAVGFHQTKQQVARDLDGEYIFSVEDLLEFAKQGWYYPLSANAETYEEILSWMKDRGIKTVWESWT